MNDSVQASLKFGVPTAGRRARAIRKGIRLEYEGSEFEDRDVLIRNGRPIADRFAIEENGFVFLHADTAARDFFDKEELNTLYYPEVESLVKRVTGASRVVIFDHTLRSGDEVMQEEKQIREPVMAVHNDYTERSGPQRVQDLMPEEADELLRHRFQIVQVWRPAVEVQSSPLAICDAASIEKDDLILTELHYENRVGEIYHLAWNPAHRWFYFPGMRPDEALVFKVYDSAVDSHSRYTAHGAFEDPDTPPGAPPRRSIEVRSLAFFTE